MKKRSCKKQEGGEVEALIQAYAQSVGADPQEILNQLQQLSPEDQQQALQDMAEELQNAQNDEVPMQYGGEWFDAAFNIPTSSFQDPRFGTTANYADTRNIVARNSFQGVLPKPPAPDVTDPDLTGLYDNPSSRNPYNFNGEKTANHILMGLSALQNGIDYSKTRERNNAMQRRMRDAGDSDSFNPFNYESPFGEHLTNVGAGVSSLKPNAYTPIQDFGTSRFKNGGEYDLSEDEISDLMQKGYDIEFL